MDVSVFIFIAYGATALLLLVLTGTSMTRARSVRRQLKATAEL